MPFQHAGSNENKAVFQMVIGSTGAR